MSAQLIDAGHLGLGYIKETRAEAAQLAARSKPFAMAAGDVQTFDPRKVLKLQYQGMMSSCTGHGRAHLDQWLNWLKTRETVLMSRMHAYLGAQRHSGYLGSDQGASIAGAVEAGRQDGATQEVTFPYPNPPVYSTYEPPASLAEGRLHLYQNSSVLTSEPANRAWLGNGLGGVCFGIDWTEGLANLRKPTIELSDLGGRILGGHCVAGIALSSRVDAQGLHYMWLANSHGPEWGQGGWAEVAAAVVAHWIQSGAAFIGVTDLQAYRRRSIPLAWLC